MATAGVSRSGRVRKKSAKLIEMENESSNVANNGNTNNNNNNNGNNNVSKTPKNVSSVSTPIQTPIIATPVVSHIATIDSDFGKPLKKKLKIKLSLGMSSNEVPQQSPVINDNVDVDLPQEEEPKKATIPPLKIPKSKFLSTNFVPLNDSCDKIIAAEEESAIAVDTPSERQEKCSSSSKRFKITVKDLNESKFSTNVENKAIESIAVNDIKTESESETSEEKNIVSETINEVIKHNESVVSIDNDIDNKNTETRDDITNVETPKLNLKKIKSTKKKEHESAANRLFRQITSGVTPPQVKSKSAKKSISIPDITPYEDYEESSLVIATEESVKVSAKKPKMNRTARQFKPNETMRKDVRKSKKSRKIVDASKPKKKRSVITAYMLWSKEHRSKIQQTCPDMDFADVSRKLGEIWQSMPKNEKTQWKRKAQKLKASALISTGKPNTTISIAKTMPFADSYAVSSLDNDDYLKYGAHDALIGTSPIDVAAHLKLLGESLNIIGQRLKEHSGQIAVSGSLSVLLDSTLCAIGPLLCLTSLEPKLDGCDRDMHKKTLDNIAYIMPGI